MTKITTIDKKFAPNQGLVEFLEGVLNDAKKGIITSVVGVTERFNGNTGEFVCVAPDADSIKLLGSLALLQHNILRAITPMGNAA